MSVVLEQAAPEATGAKLVPIRVVIHTEPVRDEPTNDYSDEVVRVVTGICRRTPLPEVMGDRFGAILPKEQLRIETEYRARVINAALDHFLEEMLTGGTPQQGPYWALYSFALFRFELKMKDLPRLAGLLGRQGLEHLALRQLGERASMVTAYQRRS